MELEEIKNTLASFEKKEAIAVHLCTLIVNDKTSTVTKLNFIVNLCSLIKSNALHLALESKEEILPPLTSNNNAQKEILPEEIIPLTEVQQKEIYDLLRKRNDIIRFDLHKSFMPIPFIDDLNKKNPL